MSAQTPEGRAATTGRSLVRQARAQDLEAVGEVHAAAMLASLDAAHRAAHGAGLPPGVRAMIAPPVLAAGWESAVTRPPSPAHHTLVATQDGKVVGLVAVAPLQPSDDVTVTGEGPYGPDPAPEDAPASLRDQVAPGAAGAGGPRGVKDVPGAAEVTALAVTPEYQRTGHGSRLLAAAVDLARADGAGALLVWAVQGDESLTRLLAGAGLAPTGARRALPVGRGVTEACWGASI